MPVDAEPFRERKSIVFAYGYTIEVILGLVSRYTIEHAQLTMRLDNDVASRRDSASLAH